MAFRTLEWLDRDARLRLVDQRVIPERVTYLDLDSAEAVAAAIRDMVVRGAPAIGVTAAYGMAIAARRHQGASPADFAGAMAAADAVLRASRPTAVNLFWALDRIRPFWQGAAEPAAASAALVAEARAMEAEDVAVNEAISHHAMAILPPDSVTFFHHCNTGALATVDRGTALGIIRTAHEAGRKVMAYLDETRPRLQGARLSAFELAEFGVPHAIVVDGAAPHVMRTRKVDIAVVGADRVAANGDTANKIGTYALALAARDNGVPFYVAAPTSTIDLATPTGDAIEIEERDPAEVTHLAGHPLAPALSPALNPAFDITPARLITGIITEKGIARAPFGESLRGMVEG